MDDDVKAAVEWFRRLTFEGRVCREHDDDGCTSCQCECGAFTSEES